MQNIVRTLTLVALSLVACHHAPAPPADEVSDWPLFGEQLAAQETVALAALFDESGSRAGGTYTVEATVDSVCPTKGCWMLVGEGEQSMRVTFKDYAFFVPKDIAGRTVRFAGVFDVEEVPVDEARHYLEDAGRLEEAALITEPQLSYVFKATGVRVAPAAGTR